MLGEKMDLKHYRLNFIFVSLLSKRKSCVSSLKQLSEYLCLQSHNEFLQLMFFLMTRGRNKQDQDSTYNLSVMITASTQAEEKNGQIVDKPDRKSVVFSFSFQLEDI